MTRLLRAVAACALALFALGTAVLPLQAAAFTRELSLRVSLADEAGLAKERMAEVAELVRAFVVEGEGELPPEVDGEPGFDASATEHLVDVRVVLRVARLATLVLGLALVAWFATVFARGRRTDVAAALRLGAVLTLALPAMGLVAALWDFDAFFAAFHSVFFASGTWVFPSDSLLIRTFPEAFWIASGGAWAVLVLTFAGCLWVAAAALERGRARCRA